jgi:hypothetical protein
MVLTNAGDQNVGIAVIVVISDCNSHAIHFNIQASAASYVRKCSVTIITVKLECASLALVPGPIHSVDEKNVLPAVGVIVEESAARTQRLREKLAAVGTIVVLELQACAGGHVNQPETRGGRFGCRYCEDFARQKR